MTEVPSPYAQIADVYDSVRRGDKPHVQWWIRRLTQAGELGPGKRLLDLGCGTGRWAIPLAQATGCEVVGVDSSLEMLDKAREKDAAKKCVWLHGDAHNPPVPPGSCDCILMSLLVHFLKDVPGAFREAYDRLRPGGVLLVRQSPLEAAAGDSIHRFFPESLVIERQRFPLRREMEFWLEEAGFSPIQAEPVRMQTALSLEDWFKEIEMRVPSILRLIPDEAYQRGLARCHQFMREHPDDTTLLGDEITLFIAKKLIRGAARAEVRATNGGRC